MIEETIVGARHGPVAASPGVDVGADMGGAA